VSKRTSESARARVAAMREAQRRQERRRRIAMIVTVVLIVILAAGIGWWTVQRGQSEEVTGLAPITVQSDGSVVMAQPGVEAPVVDVYEDFQCPVCKEFGKTSGSTLKNLAKEGKAKVVYHVLTIFGQDPTRSNSIRAAAAARCVTDGVKWMEYHEKLYEEQPRETVSGFAIDDLVKWGKEVGITDPGFESCVRDQKHAAEHEKYSEQTINSAQIGGTPTVKVNGQEVPNEIIFVPSELRKAILEAGK